MSEKRIEALEKRVKHLEKVVDKVHDIQDDHQDYLERLDDKVAENSRRIHFIEEGIRKRSLVVRYLNGTDPDALGSPGHHSIIF